MAAAEVRLSVRELRRDPEQALLRASALGGLVWVSVGRQRFLLVGEPDAVRETLVERAAVLAKPSSQALPVGSPPAEASSGDGLSASALRRTLASGMGADRAAETAAALAAEVEEAAATWRDGESLSLVPWLRPLVCRAVVTGAFASALSGEEIAQLASVVRWAGRSPRVQRRGPSRHGLTRPLALGRLSLVVRSLLANADLSRPSELSALQDLAPRERQALAGELLLGAAGPLVQESGWALFRLGTEPAAAAHLGRDGWTDAFVREVTRLHPTNPLVVRVAREHTNVGGETVPAHARVVVNVAALHRDPKVYAEPERFLPERWLDGRTAEHRFSYAAFGIGDRRCLGEAIATRSLAALLEAVGREWELSFAEVSVAAAGRRQLGDEVRVTVTRRSG